MRKPLALLAVLAALTLVGAAGATRTARVPPFPVLPGDWWHAEVNVTIAHTPHTLVLDRGRIRQLTKAGLRLRESNGSVVVIQVSAATKVVIDGAPARLRWLNATMSAETMSIDGGPAVRIDATTG